jgi:hypothetical protein
VIQTQRRRLQVLLRLLTSSLCPQVPHGETRSRKTRSSSKVRGEDAMAPEKEVDPGFSSPPSLGPQKRDQRLSGAAGWTSHAGDPVCGTQWTGATVTMAISTEWLQGM